MPALVTAFHLEAFFDPQLLAPAPLQPFVCSPSYSKFRNAMQAIRRSRSAQQSPRPMQPPLISNRHPSPVKAHTAQPSPSAALSLSHAPNVRELPLGCVHACSAVRHLGACCHALGGRSRGRSRGGIRARIRPVLQALHLLEHLHTPAAGEDAGGVAGA